MFALLQGKWALNTVNSDGSCLFSSLGAAIRHLVLQPSNAQWAEKLRQRIRQLIQLPIDIDPIPRTSGQFRNVLLSFMRANLSKKHLFIAGHKSSTLYSLLNEEIAPIQAQPGQEVRAKNLIVISDRHFSSEPIEFKTTTEYFKVSA
jgi:hypothetical protein